MIYILNSKDSSQRSIWMSLWEKWPDREVFAHPSYVELFCSENDAAICIACDNSDGGILFPLIQRPLESEIWAEELKGCYDLTSPYGYGGAFYWGHPNVSIFWEYFDNWAIKSHIISLFCRLSLFNEQLIPFHGDVEFRSYNIIRTLNIPLDLIWKQYEHKVRKNVNRARNSDIYIEIDDTSKNLEDFLEIYYSTLDRRGAKKSYYFSREFFLKITRELNGQFVFFNARKDGAIISSELVLISKTKIYSFLGGTKLEYFKDRPNDLLKHEIISWGVKEGKQFFVLGGGYEDGDGIYRYKKSFAPDGQVPFYIGKRIFNIDLYKKAIMLRRDYEKNNGIEWQPNPKYFPLYRS
jgi:hypothetical protein